MVSACASPVWHHCRSGRRCRHQGRSHCKRLPQTLGKLATASELGRLWATCTTDPEHHATCVFAGAQMHQHRSGLGFIEETTGRILTVRAWHRLVADVNGPRMPLTVSSILKAAGCCTDSRRSHWRSICNGTVDSVQHPQGALQVKGDRFQGRTGRCPAHPRTAGSRLLAPGFGVFGAVSRPFQQVWGTPGPGQLFGGSPPVQSPERQLEEWRGQRARGLKTTGKSKLCSVCVALYGIRLSRLPAEKLVVSSGGGGL